MVSTFVPDLCTSSTFFSFNPGDDSTTSLFLLYEDASKFKGSSWSENGPLNGDLGANLCEREDKISLKL